MSRLPLRLRLTLVFALAMAVVLAATGALVYVRVGDSLLEQIDDSLRARAEALAQGELAGRLPVGEEEFAQVIGPGGEVLAATPGFAGESLLDAPPEQTRLFALPAGSRTIVVGASLEDRDEALAGLLAQLLIVGPLALLLASGAGYLIAGAALRPVEAMRRRAAAISADTSGGRLPLPAARDEIHRLGTTLNAMIDRLEAGLLRERRFVADASHELRTPLASLRAELDLALRRPRTPAELERALRSASEEVDRLARLAEELLALAAADEGLNVSRFPVRELLENVARRHPQVEVGAAPSGELEGDRLRLEQALANLVDNAVRHGAPPVRLEVEADEHRVTFLVTDEGPGFPPEFLPHAFERFTRPDGARTAGGAGLGLAIVLAVARAHGGEASARNRPGGGAEVAFSIPAAPRQN